MDLKTFDMKGKMATGRYSFGDFGIGIILAFFHNTGKSDKIQLNTKQKCGNSLGNKDFTNIGWISSKPTALDLILTKCSITSSSEIYFNINLLQNSARSISCCDNIRVTLYGLKIVNKYYPTRFAPNCNPSLLDLMIHRIL